MDKLTATYTVKVSTRDIHTDNGHTIPEARQFVELDEMVSEVKSKKSQIRSLNSGSLTLDRRQTCEAYDTIYELMKTNDETNKVLKNNVVLTNESETTNVTINLDGKSLFYGK